MPRLRISTQALVTATFILLSLPSFAQQDSAQSPPQPPEQEKSLAEVARQAKKDKTAHAKKLITEDDVNAMRGPLPRLKMEGVDNSDEIIDAIGAYKAKHSDKETEQAIHDWYDEYDSMLGTAIRESTETKQRRDSTLYTGYQMCQLDNADYVQCEKRRQAEMRGARHDQLELIDNGFLVGRIQQSFIKVRSGIGRYNLHHEWFKIRNANGNGSF